MGFPQSHRGVRGPGQHPEELSDSQGKVAKAARAKARYRGVSLE